MSPPPLSSPTQSALNRQRADLDRSSSKKSDRSGSHLRLTPFEQEARLPLSEQVRTARQASEARLREEYHRVKDEQQAQRERERIRDALRREEVIRVRREQGGREQVKALDQEPLRDRNQLQLQPRQSQGTADRGNSADVGYIASFIRKVRDRFRNTPQITQQFVAMVDSDIPARELLPGVKTLFRSARDLYQDFQASMGTIDENRFQQPQPYPGSYPQSIPEPIPEPYLHQYPQPYPQSYPQLYHQQYQHLPAPPSPNIRPPFPFTGGETFYVDGDYSDGDAEPDRKFYPHLQGSEESQQHIRRLLALPEIDIAREHRRSTPAAMSCTLMEHQKVALTWLMQQEEDEHKKGGILADTMGLGKTIEALALILARPSRDRTHKTTLIVAPLSLLKQWEQEIQTKVKPSHKLKTIIYHGQAKRGMTVARLLTYDIVLTTYGTVKWENRSGTKKTPVILSHDATFYRIILDEAHNIKNRFSKASLAACRIKATYRLCMTGTPFMNRAEELYSLIRFLRIKPYDNWDKFRYDINKPIQGWNANFRDAAMGRLQALFRSITLRRTKTSILDGQPILRLPELVRKEAIAVFNEEQRAFYDALEQKQQLKVNEFLKAGTAMKKYSAILVLLLRLRQACCHPHLIKDFGIPEGAQLSSEEMRKLALKLKKEIVRKLKAQSEFDCPLCDETTTSPVIIYPCGHPICATCFSAMMEARIGTEDNGPCPQQGCMSDLNPKEVICHSFFMEVHMPEKSELSASEDLDDDSDGFESLDEEDDVNARGNLKGFIASDEEEEDEDSDSSDVEGSSSGNTKLGRLTITPDEETKCTPQKKGSTDVKTEDASDNESLEPLEDIWKRVDAIRSIGKGKLETPMAPSEDKTTPSSTPDIEKRKKAPHTKGKRKRTGGKDSGMPRKKQKGNSATGKKQRKGKKKFTSLAALKKANSGNSSARARYLKQLKQDWVTSAKINKTMEILNAIKENNPQEKTLVFSLWTSFLDLLEIPIQDQGLRYARYDGTMHHGDRDAAVKNFMEKPEVQIMLISLSAGNAGLNLTAATQVIILEPFWNPFVEEQAIDRAHRIGQKKEVTVHRVLIEKTVEDRIRALQEGKRKLVDAALSEEGAQVVSRLTLTELRGLFGLH